MGAFLKGENYPNLKSNAAILQFLRVKDGAAWGTVDIAGDEAYIGEAAFSTRRADESVNVRDKRGAGYHAFIADGAIAAGGDVSTAAAGKVTAGLGGAVDIGKAVEAVFADGDIVYVRLA